MRETSELNHRLERLLAALDSSDHPSTEEIFQATEATVNVNLTNDLHPPRRPGRDVDR